jgi:hypothetical protein
MFYEILRDGAKQKYQILLNAKNCPVYKEQNLSNVLELIFGIISTYY